MYNSVSPNNRRFDFPTVSVIRRKSFLNMLTIPLCIVMIAIMMLSMMHSVLAVTDKQFDELSKKVNGLEDQNNKLSKEVHGLEVLNGELNKRYDNVTAQLQLLREHNTSRMVQTSSNANSQNVDSINLGILSWIWYAWLTMYSVFRAILDTMESIFITHRYTRTIIIPIFFYMGHYGFIKIFKKSIEYLRCILRNKTNHSNKK